MNYKFPYLIVYFVVTLAFGLESCKKPGCTDPLASNYNSSANYNDSTCEYDTNSAYHLIWLVNHKFNTDSFSYLIDFQDDSGTLIQFTRAAIYAGNTNYSYNGSSRFTNLKYALINPLETQYDMGLIYDTLINEFQCLIGVDSITNHIDPATYDGNNPLSYQTPSMHWQMGIDPQYWSYLFIVLEGYVDKNKNNIFESGESFVYHIGNDGLTSNSNLITFSTSVNHSREFIVEFDIDWHETIRGINMAQDNFTHTMDNLTLAQSISINCSNLIQPH
ncbi:MAG: MbnP family protein [Bacteroidota bacterium]|nr:MbnP family protein [Bacteroidota bacterium]